MKSFEKFWVGVNLDAARQAEEKGCRLYFDVKGNIFYLVKKFRDGSILHTKETQLLRTRDINQVIKHIQSL